MELASVTHFHYVAFGNRLHSTTHTHVFMQSARLPRLGLQVPGGILNGCCQDFGAPPKVKKRLARYKDSRSWDRFIFMMRRFLYWLNYTFIMKRPIMRDIANLRSKMCDKIGGNL